MHPERPCKIPPSRPRFDSARHAGPAFILALLVVALSARTIHAQAVGACCTSSNNCFLASRADCIISGGIRLLIGHGCEQCNVTRGCATDGSCHDGGGINVVGFNCVDAPCELGACCAHGSCLTLQRALCANPADLFLASQGCTPSPCNPIACCNTLTGQCVVTESAGCTLTGALRLTSQTTCLPGPACSLGACCNLHLGSCTVTDGTLCSGSNVLFLGYLTPCLAQSCPRGACCDNTDGSCGIGGPLCFVPGSYTYQGDGTACSPSPCPVGACCNITSGLCTYTIQSQCSGTPGSTFHGGGVSCSPTPCPQGSCCRADGSCVAGIPNDCPSPYAFTYLATCAAGACAPGACCVDSGSCTTLGRYACAQQSGNFKGDACSPSPCTQGACCSTFNTCSTTLSTTCSTTFYAGQSCSPNPCPPGACCAITGQCGTLTSGQCSAQGFIVVGGSCSPTPCSIGHCCLPDGACVSTVASQCAAPATFAPGQPCGTVNPCPEPGVCCRGCTCAFMYDSSCTSPTMSIPAAFVPGVIHCNTNGSTSTPCCYADFNKSGGVTVADIFAFLSAWFGQSPFARVGGDGVQTPTVSDIFAFLAAWFAGQC